MGPPKAKLREMESLLIRAAEQERLVSSYGEGSRHADLSRVSDEMEQLCDALQRESLRTRPSTSQR